MPRISLRQMLLITACIAGVIGSLKYASDWWYIPLGMVTLITFIGAVLIAIFDRTSARVVAAGVAVTMAIYAVLLVDGLWRAPEEIQNYEWVFLARLPTSRLLWQVWKLVQITTVRPGISVTYTPPLIDFMRIGHCWWLLLFGYAGGRFARFLYVRRMSNPPAPTANSGTS